MKNLAGSLLILLFFSISNGQEIFSKYIGSLRPLRKTDVEVSKQFGEATVIRGKHFYKTENASVEVIYTKGCRWDESAERVEPNLIREIAFFPVKPLYFDELGIDISAYTKSVPDRHVPSVIAYSNRKAGVSFNVDTNAKPEHGGTVGLVTLWPGTERTLICSDV